MAQPRTGHFPTEVATAYLAAGARVISWAAVSALVWRRFGAEAFALLALIRGTLALLNYTGFGLAPAMIRMQAILQQADVRDTPVAGAASAPAQMTLDSVAEAHDRNAGHRLPGDQDLFNCGMILATLTLFAGLIVSVTYAATCDHIHRIPGDLRRDAWMLALTIGVGMSLRLASDAPGAVLQSHGRIALDNVLQALSEVAWLAITCWLVRSSAATLAQVGSAFFWAGALFMCGRFISAHMSVPYRPMRPRWELIRWLVGFGAIITVGSLGDFLYSPSASIIINWMRSPDDLAAYTAAIQIDAALLLLVTGLAAVMLPRAAAAVGRHDWPAVRRYYVHGTLASAGMLLAAATTTWLISPALLSVWLNHPPAATAAILPLVLIHNVVGGSSYVGRAVLLSLGKARALTSSVLLAGSANAVLCFLFLKFSGLGLKGVPLATILMVVARAGVWTPWYVLKSLREVEATGAIAPVA
jgi:O-antigen/teichoic acid export membrane protein